MSLEEKDNKDKVLRDEEIREPVRVSARNAMQRRNRDRDREHESDIAVWLRDKLPNIIWYHLMFTGNKEPEKKLLIPIASVFRHYNKMTETFILKYRDAMPPGITLSVNQAYAEMVVEFDFNKLMEPID